MKKQDLLLFALLCPIFAYSQGARYDIPPILTSAGKPVALPVISLCPGTATISGAACSPATGQSTTDITTNTLCPIGSPVTLTGLNTCQANGDTLGNAGFWLKPGSYIYCVTGSGIVGACYNLTVPIGITAAGVVSPTLSSATITGNETVGGTLGVTGASALSSATITGALTAQSYNGVLQVSKFTGADIGAQINSAVTACSVSPCQYYVDVPGTISTAPNIPQGSTLSFAPGTYTLAATFPVNHRGVQLIGNGAQFNYNQDTGSAAFFVGKNLSGTVNCSGTTTITQASGSLFTNFDPGDQIFVGASTFNVASVTDSTHLVATATCPLQSGTAYNGVMLTSLGLGSFSGGAHLKDFIINYTGAGTNAANTGIQFDLMNDPMVENISVNNFTTGKGIVLLGTQLGQFNNIRSNVNKSALILDNKTAGTQTISSNVNSFISPQIVGSPAGGNPLLIQGNAFGNKILYGDFEANLATVFGTIAGVAFNNIIEGNDHEKNGDGTTSSADWKVTAVPNASQPGQHFIRNRFTSAVANTPATGIICTGAGVLCYLRDNQWQSGDPYTSAWTFTTALGLLENNYPQSLSHTDPVGFNINLNGGWGAATMASATAGDPPAIPNAQYQRGASAANNATLRLIGANGANQVSIDPDGQGSVLNGGINFGAGGGHTFISATVPTILAAGCGGSAASIVVTNQTAAFKVNVGTTPGSACTLTFPAATTGWNVTCNDITTQSANVFVQKQTGAESTTSVTITNFSTAAAATAFTASDILKCTAFAD